MSRKVSRRTLLAGSAASDGVADAVGVAPVLEGDAEAVADAAALLVVPGELNKKKPPTPRPTTTRQTTDIIVICRVRLACSARRCCWRSMCSRASLRCRSFLLATSRVLLAACCLLTSETSRMVPAPTRS